MQYIAELNLLLVARLRRKLKIILGCTKGSRRERSTSLACITHQSSLSGYNPSSSSSSRALFSISLNCLALLGMYAVSASLGILL